MWEQALLSDSGLTAILSGLLEGVGIPWPGALVLAAAGTNAGAVLTAVAVGTFFAGAYTAGSAIQYLMGRYCRSLLDRFLAPATQKKLERLIDKYGHAAVLWTRPLAIGNYVSLPAGIMRMPLGKFLLYTFVGIWPWAVGMTVAGNWVSEQVRALSTLLPYLAAGLAFLGVASGLRKLWMNTHAAQ